MFEILKRCPFCGASAACIDEDLPEGYYTFIVHCRACYAKTTNYETYDEAVASWNKRVNDEC